MNDFSKINKEMVEFGQPILHLRSKMHDLTSAMKSFELSNMTPKMRGEVEGLMEWASLRKSILPVTAARWLSKIEADLAPLRGFAPLLTKFLGLLLPIVCANPTHLHTLLFKSLQQNGAARFADFVHGCPAKAGEVFMQNYRSTFKYTQRWPELVDLVLDAIRAALVADPESSTSDVHPLWSLAVGEVFNTGEADLDARNARAFLLALRRHLLPTLQVVGLKGSEVAKTIEKVMLNASMWAKFAMGLDGSEALAFVLDTGLFDFPETMSLLVVGVEREPGEDKRLGAIKRVKKRSWQLAMRPLAGPAVIWRWPQVSDLLSLVTQRANSARAMRQLFPDAYDLDTGPMIELIDKIRSLAPLVNRETQLRKEAEESETVLREQETLIARTRREYELATASNSCRFFFNASKIFMSVSLYFYF